MTNNIYNLDDFRKPITPDNGDVLLAGLIKHIKWGNHEIIKWLDNLSSTHEEEDFWLYMSWVQQEDVTNISTHDKAIIFRLAHTVLYKNKMQASAYLLYAMHLANASNDARIIRDMQNDLNTSLSPQQKQELINLGQELIRAWWMTQWELNIIEVQLITSQKQQELIFY